MVWTTPSDVTSRWPDDPGTFSETDLQVHIDDAEDTINGEFGDGTIQARIDSNTLPLRRVQKVVARMVIRHLRNPEGYRQGSRVEGPFTESWTFGGDEPGAMYLTDEDRNELAGRRSGQRAFAIDMGPTVA